jgi:nucleoside phosphorylase
LNPALRFGDVVVASKIAGGKLGSFYPAAPPRTNRSFFPGTMVSQDRVAGTALEKRRLRESGGDAVEMEAAALAQWAFESGIPFHCVRVVSDTAEEDFRIDLNEMRNSDGHFSKLRIVAAALRRPAELGPELIRLGRKSREAAVVLGDFLASCEF